MKIRTSNFATPDFEDRLVRALGAYVEAGGEVADFGILEPDGKGPDDYDEPLTEEWGVQLELLSSPTEYPELSLREFVEYTETAFASQSDDSSSLRCPTESYFHIAPTSNAAWYFRYYADPATLAKLKMHCTIGGENYRAEIAAKNFNVFHIYRAVVRAERFHEELPGHDSEDLFLLISHTASAPASTVHTLAKAFLFELAASVGVPFDFSQFLNREDLDGGFGQIPDELEEVTSGSRLPRLYPPILGNGIDPLYATFLLAEKETLPVEYRVLEYLKVLEYVSATVLRQELHHNLRRILRTPAALDPDAHLLEDVQKAVEESTRARKDPEALRLTLLHCIDRPSIVRLLPDSLVPKTASKSNTDAVISKFAKCLSATRNQIAHAKANYDATGDEISGDLLESTIPALRSAAIQAIRWYGALPDSQRVFP